MSKDQIKTEINKVLDNFSDRALNELLVYLKEMNSRSNIYNPQDLYKILSEDKNLLERLAK